MNGCDIKFYCIYKEGDKRTEDLLSESTLSAKQFNINVIPYPGIYSNIQEHIDKHNLKINNQGSHKFKTDGVKGCFLSHFYLWKKCIETNTAIGVLEYDAIFIRQLPSNILQKFDHYLNLDYSRHLYLRSKDVNYANFVKNDNRSFEVLPLKELGAEYKTKNLFKYVNNNHIQGAFGYILKPKGAELLIDATKKYGILPADIQPNLAYCNIHYTIPSIVMLNDKTLIGRVKNSHTSIDRTY